MTAINEYDPGAVPIPLVGGPIFKFPFMSMNDQTDTGFDIRGWQRHVN